MSSMVKYKNQIDEVEVKNNLREEVVQRERKYMMRRGRELVREYKRRRRRRRVPEASRSSGE